MHDMYNMCKVHLVPNTKYTKYFNYIDKYCSHIWSPIGSIPELRKKIDHFLKRVCVLCLLCCCKHMHKRYTSINIDIFANIGLVSNTNTSVPSKNEPVASLFSRKRLLGAPTHEYKSYYINSYPWSYPIGIRGSIWLLAYWSLPPTMVLHCRWSKCTGR